MSIKIKQKAKQGFTLVELSIVIVIIGFLVAGIAAGANMVKQAQIRSVISDLQSYQTAFNNFKAKYNKVPGDMDTATSFWPADGQCLATVSGNEDVCDGDNDGLINNSTSAGVDETAPALKHLALANMISAGIPVLPTTKVNMKPGVNAPVSKISGAGYFMGYPGVGTTYNVVALGKPVPVGTGVDLFYGAMKPEDAFGIDQKIDDGIVTGAVFSGAFTGNFGARDGIDVVAPKDCMDTVTSEYTIATEYQACFIAYRLD